MSVLSVSMQNLYEKLSPEDKELLWDKLNQAILWRGWDNNEGVGPFRGTGSRAGAFVTFVVELGSKYDIGFMEYT